MTFSFSVLGHSSFGTNILGVLTRGLGVPIRDLGVLIRTQQLVRRFFLEWATFSAQIKVGKNKCLRSSRNEPINQY